MSNLYQLVYTSRKQPSCNNVEIDKILDSCKRNNGSKDITGVLLHTDQNFIQYLEGPKEIINLYDLIKEDKRHMNVVLLSYRITKKRFFPSWQMGYKDMSGNKLQLLTENLPKEKLIFQQILNGEIPSENSAINMISSFFKKAA